MSDRKINWLAVHRIRRARKEKARLTALGFRNHETDWEILRGGRTREVIVEAVIAHDGKSVWTRIGTPASKGETE